MVVDVPVHSNKEGMETNRMSTQGSAYLLCGYKGNTKAMLQTIILGWLEKRLAAIERLS